MRLVGVRPQLMALLVVAVALVGCMPGPNPLKGTPIADGDTAGFWLGLWHGMIGPVTFVMSLFKDETGFYEVHNNGGWYNAGFLLGLGMVLGGGFQGNVQLRRGGPVEPVPPPTPSEEGKRGAEVAPEREDAPAEDDRAKDGDDDDLPPRGPRTGPAN